MAFYVAKCIINTYRAVLRKPVPSIEYSFVINQNNATEFSRESNTSDTTRITRIYINTKLWCHN